MFSKEVEILRKGLKNSETRALGALLPDPGKGKEGKEASELSDCALDALLLI